MVTFSENFSPCISAGHGTGWSRPVPIGTGYGTGRDGFFSIPNLRDGMRDGTGWLCNGTGWSAIPSGCPDFIKVSWLVRLCVHSASAYVFELSHLVLVLVHAHSHILYWRAILIKLCCIFCQNLRWGCVRRNAAYSKQQSFPFLNCNSSLVLVIITVGDFRL
jgi:hypothetical protein